jgi:hypothetical protein
MHAAQLLRTPLSAAFAALLALSGVVAAPPANAAVPFPVESLDGNGDNVANPAWGRAGKSYSRVAAARYEDGIAAPASGPNSRRVSNRVFNDSNQNIFSERQVSQWGGVWGQFLDHTFALANGSGKTARAANIPFKGTDPLESFANDLGVIPFTRSAATAGTGTSKANPRQQTNLLSSYIDAFPVYGGTNERLEWLREGSVDGNLDNNSARLMLPGNYLPRRTSRGAPASAPVMRADGRLAANPNNAMVAGEVRANENLALTATQTLFAREHNRIVSQLPSSLSEEEKFQIARRVVIAEQQYITYNEFLPAMGINLPAYSGYNPRMNATVSNEFATVGYRAHSQIHGEVEVETEAARYTAAQLDAFKAQGIEVETAGDEVKLAIPLNVAFFNPDLVPALQLGPLLKSVGVEAEYRNDEQIDNQLRSALFQVPVSGNPTCLDGPTLPQCFKGVADLGAMDLERGRDHGMPSYNRLRKAYGLPARTSFTAITGEPSAAFPADPKLTPGNKANDPDGLDFTRLLDLFGLQVDTADPVALSRTVVEGVRRAPLAARLRALYRDVNKVDALVGMVAEPHVPGSELGELQQAIWTRQFQRLRDGDRFFYGNDQGLTFIRNTYKIDYRRNLGDIVALNTDIPRAKLAPNVFFVNGERPPTSCHVTYTKTDQSPGNFQVNMRISNTGSTPIDRWTLRWTFPDGQHITQLSNGVAAQSGVRVPVSNTSSNASIPAGGSINGIRFNATHGATNPVPANFTLNTTPCTTG